MERRERERDQTRSESQMEEMEREDGTMADKGRKKNKKIPQRCRMCTYVRRQRQHWPTNLAFFKEGKKKKKRTVVHADVLEPMFAFDFLLHFFPRQETNCLKIRRPAKSTAFLLYVCPPIYTVLHRVTVLCILLYLALSKCSIFQSRVTLALPFRGGARTERDMHTGTKRGRMTKETQLH